MYQRGICALPILHMEANRCDITEFNRGYPGCPEIPSGIVSLT
jgi:hypothetical protein